MKVGLLFCWLGFSAIALAEAPPALLSQTGLYQDIGQKTVAAENFPYSPQYPLWSDGAEKQRWIYLPPGQKINTGSATGPTSPAHGNIDYWVFPVGTKFWKEFTFVKPGTSEPHRVETRLSTKTGFNSWTFATYTWNEAETEATLAPAEGIKDYYPSAPGFTHDIPSRQDCLTCHNKGGDQVLGFDTLQLSSDRDPLAPHAQKLGPADLTLDALIARKLVTYLPPTVTTNPPRIISSTPEGRAAMGYLHANCGNCHNPSGPAGFTFLLFRYPYATTSEATSPVFTSAVDKRCYQFTIPGRPDCLRIKSGDPDGSSIAYRMNDPIVGQGQRMPPLGTKFPDAQAVALLRNWILKLKN